MKLLRSFLVLALAIVFLAVGNAFGQSLITGDLKGQVLDPSEASVPDASVTLKSVDTGASQEAQTDSTGYFTFALLKPGSYEITVTKRGFAQSGRKETVDVGKTTLVNMQLEVSSAAVTVEVTAAPEVINTDAAPSTTYAENEVRNLPNPGGDITNIAFTSPGVLVAVNQSGSSGYGNFTANGLPATSNVCVRANP